jgi:hypothetical protein
MNGKHFRVETFEMNRLMRMVWMKRGRCITHDTHPSCVL